MARAVRLALLASGLLAAGALFAWLRDRTPSPPTRARPATETASEFQGVVLVDVDSDGTRWRVSADEGTVWEADGRGELKSVRAEFEKGEGVIRAAAGRGRIESKEEVRLVEGVTLAWQGYRAEAEEATYRRGVGMVVVAGPVVLTGPGIRVRGRGLEVDVDGRRARVRSEVAAVVGEDRP